MFLPYLHCDARFLLFYGGAGSGKSYFVAQKIVYRLLTAKMANFLVVRKTADSNRHSTFSMLQLIIEKFNVGNLFLINKSDMTITCKNGNMVLFKGLDDSEKLKSITFPHGVLTDIWIEEASEIEEADLNQLNVRLRGRADIRKQIILSFNPIAVTHWLKARFFDRVQENAVVVHTTYKDNMFIDEAYKRELEAFRDTDEYYYAVYCLGEWGVLGKTVFAARHVHDQLAKNIQPKRRGYFTYTLHENGTVSDILFTDDADGCILVYEPPIQGHPYVLGGDTAGEGSDFFAAQVMDNTTGAQVCVLHQETDEDLYALQVYCLGMWYNTALVGIERNYSTHPVKELERLRYPNLHVIIDDDRYTHKPKQVFGFITSSKTRPAIIAALVKVMRETPERIVDRLTLEEMLTFVRNERGRPEAENGKHDDLIMALAICNELRQYQTHMVTGKRKKARAEWKDDMWVDYYNGSEKERQEMLALWGNPFE